LSAELKEGVVGGKAKQKAKQSAAVSDRRGPPAATESSENPRKSHISRSVQSIKADGEGFEPPVAFRLRQFSRLLP
jgi:hypothetical protein